MKDSELPENENFIVAHSSSVFDKVENFIPTLLSCLAVI